MSLWILPCGHTHTQVFAEEAHQDTQLYRQQLFLHICGNTMQTAKATPPLKRHAILLCLHHNPQDYCLYHTLTHTGPGSLVYDLWSLASHVPTSLVLQLRLDL